MMLAQKYTQQGYEISRFGSNSQALRKDGQPLFVFTPGITIDEDFVNKLCEYHARNTRKPAAANPLRDYSCFSS
jgi:hypothetical protein